MEKLISGPAGTGKSLACLLRLVMHAGENPHTRCLIVRKTRVALTDAALLTLERDIFGYGSPVIGSVTRAGRRAYILPNGSEIATVGLDKASKVMSQDWDLIYVQEAIDLTEPEWETLTTRLGRAGGAGYLIGDTNPDKPTHWLKRRCERGICELIESRHEDNPMLWDGSRWTAAAHRPDGTGYIDRLDRLTGVRHARLRKGRWVQAEGTVYENWDAAVHLVDNFEVPEDWPRYLTVDFGYTNPFCCLWGATDPDGRLFLYREIYYSHRLVEDHAVTMQHYIDQEPRPYEIICDHDAEGRATLERKLGISTTAAQKLNKDGSIEEVMSRLRVAGDGRPRLFIMRGALVERDPWLDEHRLPASTVEEFDGYIWNLKAGRKKGEEPVDKDNHGMDAMRYLAAHLATGAVGEYHPMSDDVETAADRAGAW